MKLVKSVGKWIGYGIYAVCLALLMASVLPVGGWKALDVLTGSMKPEIQPGDLVIIHSVPLHDIHTGDIVTYLNPDAASPQKTITHRVVAMPVKDGLQMVITKGDANPVADSPFAGGRIIGKVELHIPNIGKILQFLHNPVSLLLLIIFPGTLVIWSEIQILKRSLARANETKAKSKSTPTKSEPPKSDPPPDPPVPQIKAPPSRRPVRSMDSMDRKMLGIILVGAVIASVGTTFAKTTTDRVAATGEVTITAPATPTSADQCKKGGWETFKNPDGSKMFKNQGQCVAFVNSNNPGKHTTNNTTVTITNNNFQNATSGNTTGGSSGGAGNKNSTSSPVTVTN